MELLTTTGMSHQIENLIKKANEEIWLISPYLKIHDKLFDRIITADERGVNITIIYGKSELSDKEWSKLNLLKNTNIYFCSNLHAKVFINENFGLVGSMNLYDYSQINNIELGALFYKDEDTEFYQNSIDEIRSIINLSEVKQERNSNDLTKEISDEDRMAKGIRFYGQFEQYFNEFTMEVVDNIVAQRKIFKFSGVLKNKEHIHFSNELGFISVWSDRDDEVTDEIRDKARAIALNIDTGNRFYNHRHANRFCVYDPKHSGLESYLDDGDAEVIKGFIRLLK